MEKAYDFNDLKNKLAKHGAQLSEEAAEAIAGELFVWIEESAALSKTPYDDMALILMPQLKKMVFEKLNKIDGQEG